MDQEVVNDNAANETTETTETRREMLKKIGLALAAVPVAAALAQGEAAQAQPRFQPNGKALALDPKINTLVSDVEGKEFSLFFAKAPKSGVASVVVVPDSDRASTSTAIKNLGGKPARGKVVGGVIQIDLGLAAEGRCSGNSGSLAAASFNPVGGGDPFKGAPIMRNK